MSLRTVTNQPESKRHVSLGRKRADVQNRARDPRAQNDDFRAFLRRPLLDHEEFERDLRQLEDEAGLPAFYRSKPIPERMAAIGMSQAAIDHVSTWLDAIVRIASGRSDELPDNVKMNLPPTQTPNSLARNYWRVSFRATGRPEPSRSAGAPCDSGDQPALDSLPSPDSPAAFLDSPRGRVCKSIATDSEERINAGFKALLQRLKGDSLLDPLSVIGMSIFSPSEVVAFIDMGCW